jgi:hypothetical protein
MEFLYGTVRRDLILDATIQWEMAMRTIPDVQGKLAFDRYMEFRKDYESTGIFRTPPTEISSEWPKEKSTDVANAATHNPWLVKSYAELIDAVAFLTSVNYRWLLFFRGGDIKYRPLPVIFRDQWKCFGGKDTLPITDYTRQKYWKYLIDELGPKVAEICREEGAPNYWHIKNVREAQWAVIQHYGLWPTPLIDLTLNLRVAASFALHGNDETKDEPEGYVFVVGMPDLAGSITHDSRERVVLIRLQSACPPVAKRPHYQEGFLAGTYPIYDISLETQQDYKNNCDLKRRVIAIFKIDNSTGTFWDKSFAKVQRRVLYPNNHDRLRDRFTETFDDGEKLREKVQELCADPYRQNGGDEEEVEKD